jgi:hypothetical protein
MTRQVDNPTLIQQPAEMAKNRIAKENEGMSEPSQQSRPALTL